MLPGEPAPELPTDQQCDHCGRFFRTKGIESHEENCPVKKAESVEYDGSGYSSSQCEHCGVWATTSGTVHDEDCPKNESVDGLGPAESVLAPFGEIVARKRE
jgi:hypothetical protein